MCFGNTANTTGQTKTVTSPSWLTNASQQNLDYAQSLQNSGFSPYTGNQVASFSPQQQQSFGMGQGIADSASANVPLGGEALANYTTAGAQSVSPQTIASNMSPYMSQYVNMALQPQLQAEQQQFAGQNKSYDSAATGSGAFGDSSWNLGRTNLTNQQDIANQGLVGNAYNAAFNTAIGAGAQDVANNLQGQTTNANLQEQALNRQLTGANAIFGQGTGATNLENTLGGQQTAQTQAGLNAAYNQWLMAQQYPFQTIQALNSTIGAATPGAGGTQNNAVDNSGWGMAASLGGAALGGIFGGPIGASLGASLGGSMAGSGSPMTFSPSTGAGSYGNGNSYPMYADGGMPTPGQPSIVGERGPEIFTPQQPGTVIPYEQLQAAMASRSGVPVPQQPGAAGGMARAPMMGRPNTGPGWSMATSPMMGRPNGPAAALPMMRMPSPQQPAAAAPMMQTNTAVPAMPPQASAPIMRMPGQAGGSSGPMMQTNTTPQPVMGPNAAMPMPQQPVGAPDSIMGAPAAPQAAGPIMGGTAQPSLDGGVARSAGLFGGANFAAQPPAAGRSLMAA